MEGDNEEVIILDSEDNAIEIGKKVMMGAKERLPDHVVATGDDDEIIDYFLDNNPDWVVCQFYL